VLKREFDAAGALQHLLLPLYAALITQMAQTGCATVTTRSSSSFAAGCC